MKKIVFFTLLALFYSSTGWSQSADYQQQKAEKIAKGSVFTKIINRELPADIVYEDDDIIAFVPLRLQAPVHLLIVPKKEI
ncbi:MAG: HIT domain-containing protein, partial [Imperialibacter sp.]